MKLLMVGLLGTDAVEPLGEAALISSNAAACAASCRSSRLARATFVSFNSIFFEVPDAWRPSAMFWTPESAACTIWSWVRLRRSM